MKYDVCVVGGFGHVGAGLGLAFADSGVRTCALDINEKVYEIMSKGKMPFKEEGAEKLLKKTLANGMYQLSLSKSSISQSKNIIVVIGTPIGEHFSPKLNVVEKFMSDTLKYMKDGQLLILRSTIYPGTTASIEQQIRKSGKKIEVAYCPERILEGVALKELHQLPQIVASNSKAGRTRASKLFKNLTEEIVETRYPLEAELAKLFSNNLRYIQFSIANQLFIVANEAKADYYRIKELMTYKYPRASGMLKAGLAAGPCLFKDIVQTNSFNNYNFPLGNAAISVNEGMPVYIFNKLRQKYNLSKMTIGILGMSFKAESDDLRDSLSTKLKELFEFEGKKVVCSDPYVKGLASTDELIKKSDIIILATPHKIYSKLKIPRDKILVDVWNFYEKGCII